VNVIQTGLAPTLVLVSGLPKDVFDGLQAQLAVNRSIFYRDLAAGPFYGFNRQGRKPRRRSSKTGGGRA